MAKIIDKIIQSKTAPKSNNVLWDDGENLKINRNNKWESIGSSDLSTQVFTIPEELFGLGELTETEDTVVQAIPINILEEYYKTDWDLMINKICKFGIVVIGSYIPLNFVKVPNESGTEYEGINITVVNPINSTRPCIGFIQNKTAAQDGDFVNFGVILIAYK